MNKQELIKHFEEMEYVSIVQMGKKSFIDMIEQLDEPQKPVVPQFVADWIEYCKKHDFTLFGCLDPENGFESLVNETFEGDVRKCIRWCRKESNILAHAWLYGHTVEKEKRYLVKMKGLEIDEAYLKFQLDTKYWYMGIFEEHKHARVKHTKTELEEAGFGEVLNSPLFEVEEVVE